MNRRIRNRTLRTVVWKPDLGDWIRLSDLTRLYCEQQIWTASRLGPFRKLRRLAVRLRFCTGYRYVASPKVTFLLTRGLRAVYNSVLGLLSLPEISGLSDI